MRLLTRIAKSLSTTLVTTLIMTAFGLGQSPVRRNTHIAPVTGESWLHHLHRSFDETSMGKTWHLGSDDMSTGQFVIPASSSVRFDSSGPHSTGFVRGSDLYRMNCQGCHRESGLGAPPEIASLINPVRATSAALVEQRMKKIGMELNRRQTAQMVSEARNALLTRLHDGGTSMPSFQHLNEAETRSLVAYLQQLAGIPGAEKQQAAIQEPRARIGELIVKSTCHICHSATGSNPTPAALLAGAIPPLSSLPVRVSQAQLVRKVTRGAPVVMGAMSSTFRGRMPVFDYLTADEAADVYEYLIHYPPTELAEVDETARVPLPDSPNQPPVRRSEVATAQFVAPQSSAVQEQRGVSLLPFGFGLFVLILVALECWITFREFKKLSIRRPVSRPLRHALIKHVPEVTTISAVEIVMSFAGARTKSLERKVS